MSQIRDMHMLIVQTIVTIAIKDWKWCLSGVTEVPSNTLAQVLICQCVDDVSLPSLPWKLYSCCCFNWITLSTWVRAWALSAFCQLVLLSSKHWFIRTILCNCVYVRMHSYPAESINQSTNSITPAPTQRYRCCQQLFKVYAWWRQASDIPSGAANTDLDSEYKTYWLATFYAYHCWNQSWYA